MLQSKRRAFSFGRVELYDGGDLVSASPTQTFPGTAASLLTLERQLNDPDSEATNGLMCALTRALLIWVAKYVQFLSDLSFKANPRRL